MLSYERKDDVPGEIEKISSFYKKDLRKEIERLGLEWEVVFFENPKLSTCECSSHPEEKKHFVSIDKYTMREYKGRRGHLLHELCHLHLAEKIDACFSCLILQEGQEFTEQDLETMFICWIPIDIWVDKIKNWFFPEETKADYYRTKSEIDEVFEKNPRAFSNAQLQIALALFLTESYIFGKSTRMKKKIKSLPRSIQKRIREIKKILIKMYDDEMTVKNLQFYIRKFMGIWGVKNKNFCFEWSKEKKCHLAIWR